MADEEGQNKKVSVLQKITLFKEPYATNFGGFLTVLIPIGLIIYAVFQVKQEMDATISTTSTRYLREGESFSVNLTCSFNKGCLLLDPTADDLTGVRFLKNGQTIVYDLTYYFSGASLYVSEPVCWWSKPKSSCLTDPPVMNDPDFWKVNSKNGTSFPKFPLRVAPYNRIGLGDSLGTKGPIWMAKVKFSNTTRKDGVVFSSFIFSDSDGGAENQVEVIPRYGINQDILTQNLPADTADQILSSLIPDGDYNYAAYYYGGYGCYYGSYYGGGGVIDTNSTSNDTIGNLTTVGNNTTAGNVTVANNTTNDTTTSSSYYYGGSYGCGGTSSSSGLNVIPADVQAEAYKGVYEFFDKFCSDKFINETECNLNATLDSFKKGKAYFAKIVIDPSFDNIVLSSNSLQKIILDVFGQIGGFYGLAVAIMNAIHSVYLFATGKIKAKDLVEVLKDTADKTKKGE